MREILRRVLMLQPPNGIEISAAQACLARQIHAVARILPFLLVANSLNVLLIWLGFHQLVTPQMQLGWIAIMSAAGLGMLHFWWRGYRHGPPALADGGDIAHLSALTFLLACGYGLGFIVLFPLADFDQRLVLGVMLSGLMSAGALSRATVPPAVLVWMLVLNATALAAALELSLSNWDIVLGLTLVYDLTILGSVLSLSKMFAARLKAEMAAAQQEQVVGLLLRDFEAHASNWLWECDDEGRLTRVSARMAQMIGRDAEALLGTDLYLVMGGDPALRQRLAEPVPFRDHVVEVVLAGQPNWWSLSAKPILDHDANHVGWRGVGADITEARRAEQQLQIRATRDELTGLTNRTRFRTMLNEKLAENNGLAMLLIDLDNFKSVNDSLGHATGDTLLQLMSRRFASRVEDIRFLARLGGDEFALLVEGVSDPAAATGWANTLLDVLRDPYMVDDARIEISASIGVVLAPLHGTHSDQLFSNADAALYAAKAAGGNRMHLFDVTLGAKLQQKRNLVRDLGKALAQRQFALLYQPQVDMDSGRITAFEVLLRWHHPEHGLIGPDQFIPLAEETGQIIPIGAWVLEQACLEARYWREDIKVAVNLSAVQLNSRSIVDSVADILKRSSFPPSRLELEVTESALILDDAAARATLAAFRAMQIEIALDDFGMGYSMLSYLRDFPFDKLKIDHSFVATLVDSADQGHRGIFRAIVDLATALDLRAVAEGVDSEEKLTAVRSFGCNVVQGHLIARPMPAAEVWDFIVSQRKI